MSEEAITIRLALKNAAKVAAEARLVGKSLKQIGDDAEEANKKAKHFEHSLNLVESAMTMIRPAALIASIGILGQALGATTAAAIGFAGALAPVIGLLGALPALGVLVGQGLGVGALGLMGIKDALGGLNGQIDPKKFALLSNEAQGFVLQLDNMKAPIRAIQQSVQAGLLPGLAKGLKSALPALNALKGPLTGTARVLGDFGAHLGALVGSKGFMKDLADQANFNNVQLRRLGGAGLHTVNIFRNLMVAARPLVSWLVRMVSGWAASADKATEFGRKSGGLARGFKSIEMTTMRVIKIFQNLAVAIFNIGKAGKRDIGDGLLVSLVHATTALRRWTESGPGIHKINNFFREARPVVAALGKLLKDTATQLLRFTSGSTGGLVGTIGMFDSLVNVLGRLSRLVGPDTVIYAFLAGKVLLGVLKLAKGFMAAATAIQVFRESAIGLAIATRVLTGAQWALDAALSANPIGLAVIAVVALAGGFLYAYKHVKWFHNAVDSVFWFIKRHWPLLLVILTGPFGLAALFIVKHLDSIVGFVTKMPGRIASAAKGMWDGLKTGLTAAINWIIGKVNFLIKGYNSLPFTPDIDLIGKIGADGGPIGHRLLGGLVPALPGASAPAVPRTSSHGPKLHTPKLASTQGMSLFGGAASAPIELHNHTVVQLDGQPIAEDVSRRVVEHTARA